MYFQDQSSELATGMKRTATAELQSNVPMKFVIVEEGEYMEMQKQHTHHQDQVAALTEKNQKTPTASKFSK